MEQMVLMNVNNNSERNEERQLIGSGARKCLWVVKESILCGNINRNNDKKVEIT